MNPKKKKPKTKTVHISAARLLAAFHATADARDQVRAIALLAGAREVLRAIVKLGPAVPAPKGQRTYPLTLKVCEVPLELLQAAGDLLPPINELLKGAQR